MLKDGRWILQRSGEIGKTGAFQMVETVFQKHTIDEFVRSRNCAGFVIPAKAGIQSYQAVVDSLSFTACTRLRGDESLFLRVDPN
jgi:hypothetical protein